MTILQLREDRPTPKAVYNWRVYLCAATASFASCMIGYDSAFIGTTLALPSFTSEFHFDTYSPGKLALVQQNIVSVYQAGAFFGSLAAYVSSYFVGRRYSLLFFTTIFLIGAGINLRATGEAGLGFIIGGRVLAGFGVGGCSNMTVRFIIHSKSQLSSTTTTTIAYAGRTAYLHRRVGPSIGPWPSRWTL